MSNATKPARRTQGMNWIRKERRLAIYLRDGLACAWCGEGVEEGVQLTLDHLIPHASGGGNDPTNLVTACHRCNSVRRDRSIAAFAADAAAYHRRATATAILAQIASTTRRGLDVAAAKALIAARGWAACVANNETEEKS